LDRDQHRHDGHDCHDATPGHQHADGTTDTNGGDDGNDDMATGFKVIFKGVDLYRQGTGEIVCAAAAGGVSSKLLNAISAGGSKALKWLTGVVVEARVTTPCDWLWNKYLDSTQQYLPDGTGGDSDDDGTDSTDSTDGGDGGSEADPDAPDNTDYTYDGGKYARRMCRQYSNEYFCNLVAANEPGGDE